MDRQKRAQRGDETVNLISLRMRESLHLDNRTHASLETNRGNLWQTTHVWEKFLKSWYNT